MKKLLGCSALVAAILFSGCSDKDPIVDTNSSKNQSAVSNGSNAQNGANSGIDTSGSSSSQPSNGGETVIATPVVDSGSNNQVAADVLMAALEKELVAVYFEYDKYDLTDDTKAKITKGVALLKDKAAKLNLKLEGNCDEFGSDEYNIALGLKRANEVKKALVAEGVADARISIVSFGESNPVCKEKTQECYAQNRRVDFKLLP